MLAAAVELAQYPRLESAPLHGRARSPNCGSSLELDLAVDPHERVAQIGMMVRACAVGQAAAAIFARHARGRSLKEIAAAHHGLIEWLGSDGPTPHWPDLELIASARDYPGRHGAVLLPWKAAITALSSVPASG